MNKLILALVFLLAILTGCNEDTTIIEGESNSSLRVKSSTAIDCDDILEINIQGKEANVTIGDDAYFSSGDLFIDYYIYADCNETNESEVL